MINGLSRDPFNYAGEINASLTSSFWSLKEWDSLSLLRGWTLTLLKMYQVTKYHQSIANYHLPSAQIRLSPEYTACRFTCLCDVKRASEINRCPASTWPLTHRMAVTQKAASTSCPPSGWLLRGGEGRQGGSNGVGREEAAVFHDFLGTAG